MKKGAVAPFFHFIGSACGDQLVYRIGISRELDEAEEFELEGLEVELRAGDP